MADSRVVFEVIATAKGLKVVHKDLKKTSDETKKLAGNQDKAAKSGNKYHKQQKGVAQANLSGAKGFSKMNETLGGGGSSGLVAAYATLAANVFAATAAFSALKKAAQIDVLIDSLTILGAASGQNLGLLATRIRDASGAAIDLAQAMQTASVGASAGFSSTQIEGLATVARQAALALGRDVGDAVDRLTRGAAKLEPEILDELGIFVRLDDAAAKYAVSIGKGATELTRFEKRQAFANEILDQGAQKFGKLGNLDASAFDRLGATLMDLAKTFTSFFNSVLGPIAGFLAANQIALAGLIAVLTKGIITAALPMLSKLGSKMGMVAQQAISSAQIQINANIKAAASYTAQLKPIKGTLSAYTGLVQKYRDGTITVLEQQKAEKLLNDYIMANAASRNAVVQARVDLARQELATVQQLNTAKDNVTSNKNLNKEGKAELNFANRGEKIFKDLDAEPGFKGFQKAFKKANKSGSIYRQRMDRAGASTKIFGNTVPFLSKGLAKGGIAFKSFGLSAKVAVKGIFTAIPVIGQVLLVVDLLIAGIKKLIGFIAGMIPEATKLEKANDALASSLQFVADNQTAAKVASQSATEELKVSGGAVAGLIISLKEQAKQQKTAEESANLFGKALMLLSNRASFFGLKFSAIFDGLPLMIKAVFKNIQIAVAQGVEGMMEFLDPAIVTINKLLVAGGVEPIELLSKTQAQKIAVLKEELVEIEKLQKRQLTLDAVNFFGPGAVDEVRAIQSVLIGTGAASKELAKFLGTDNITDFANSLAATNGSIEDLPENLRALSKSFDENNDGVLQSSELNELLASALEVGTRETVAMNDATNELEQGIRNGNQKLSEYLNTFTKKGAISSFATTLNGLVDQMDILNTMSADGNGLRAIDEAFKAADSSMRNGIMSMIVELPAEQAKYNAELKKFLALNEKNTEEDFKQTKQSMQFGKSIHTATKLYQKLVKEIEFAQLFSAATLAGFKRQETALKKYSKLNLAATGAQIDMANTQSQLKVTDLQREQKLRIAGNQHLLDAFATEEGRASMTAVELGKVAQIKDVDEQIAGIKEKIIGTEEKTALLANETLKIDVKKLQASKALATSKAAELKAQQLLASAQSGMGLRQTPEELLKAQIKAKELAIVAAKEEARIQGKRLEIELLITEARLLAAGIKDSDLITRIKAEMGELSEIQQKVLDQKVKTLEAEKKLLGLSKEGVLNTELQSVKTTEAMAKMKTALEEGGLKDTKLFTPEMFAGMNEALEPMRAALMELGPEGELIAMAQEGIFSLATSFSGLGAAFEKGGKEGFLAGAEAASQAISVISGLMQANTKAQVSEIDNQIKAEQNRDGKSKESLAKIAGMEKKKEQIQRKAFEMKKKMDIAQAVISTALGVARAIEMGPIVGPILAVMQAAMGMAQVALIKKQTFQGGGGATVPKVSSIEVGKRDKKVDVAQGATAGETGFLRGNKGIGSNANNFAPGGASGRKGYANGGEILVGERGPEVIQPTSGGYNVIPNDKIGGTSNVNFTINAVDTAGVQDLLQRQRGNIIGMIREAAHEHGEEFMEPVNIEAY